MIAKGRTYQITKFQVRALLIVAERAAFPHKMLREGHGAVFCQYEKEQLLTWSLVNLAPMLTGNT